jgi:hypothetical protein
MGRRSHAGGRHGHAGGRYGHAGGRHPGKYGHHGGKYPGRHGHAGGRHPGKYGHHGGKYPGRHGHHAGRYPGRHGHAGGKYPHRNRDGGYHGRHNHHWNRCHWSSQHNCWLYGCGAGAAACSYYWCEPDNCYYPVEYQPYNTCSFEESVPVCSYTGPYPIYYGQEQTCWTTTCWSEPLRCYLYCVGSGPSCVKYYWCPPDDCYYPVEYKPYGVCSFEEATEGEETGG